MMIENIYGNHYRDWWIQTQLERECCILGKIVQTRQLTAGSTGWAVDTRRWKLRDLNRNTRLINNIHTTVVVIKSRISSKLILYLFASCVRCFDFSCYGPCPHHEGYCKSNNSEDGRSAGTHIILYLVSCIMCGHNQIKALVKHNSREGLCTYPHHPRWLAAQHAHYYIPGTVIITTTCHLPGILLRFFFCPAIIT